MSNARRPLHEEVADIAAANTLNVIATTRSSPLARQANHAFFIPHASSFYWTSMAAAHVVFVAGLLNLGARTIGPRVASAPADRGKMTAKMNVEI